MYYRLYYLSINFILNFKYLHNNHNIFNNKSFCKNLILEYIDDLTKTIIYDLKSET